jgi:hypothetical protein
MTAEKIVRALAAADPLALNNVEEKACALCWVNEETDDDDGKRDVWADLTDPTIHKPNCPWRLAREWVADHT